MSSTVTVEIELLRRMAAALRHTNSIGNAVGRALTALAEGDAISAEFNVKDALGYAGIAQSPAYTLTEWEADRR